MIRQGFFKPSEIASTKPLKLIAECDKCGLWRGCTSPKMEVSGRGKRKILVVGEAPGRDEDLQGKAFVGPSGQLLQETLRRYGVELREDCWVTNAAICRPKNNQLPEKAIDFCRPNLIKTIKELSPEVILLLGGSAVKGLIDYLWRDEEGTATGVYRWVGWQIPCQEINAWVCPTWHPSYLLHERDDRTGRVNEPLELLFEQHLQKMTLLSGRPWKQLPDYLTNIKRVTDITRASEMIQGMIGDKPVCWDLETNSKKPEGDASRILCCGVSDGITSFAFPWHGEAIEAMRELLESKTPKIGWNAKFDARWVRTKHNIRTRNWLWDGILAAHALDSRHRTKSLEFQAFVRLGVKSHKTLKKWMKGEDKSGYAINQLATSVKLEQLLAYAAQDARLEWELAQLQMKELGHG